LERRLGLALLLNVILLAVIALLGAGFLFRLLHTKETAPIRSLEQRPVRAL
jgi:hypothetical protein